MLDNIEKDIKRLKKSICCLNSAIADCCYTEVTLAEMQSLVASNSLKTGSFYGISDANAENLYGGTLVILQAVTSNKLSEAGHGVFYNPIYDRTNEWLGMWHEIGFFTGSNLTLEFEMFEPITADNGATGELIVGGGDYKTYFKPLTGNWAAATSITGDNSGATLDIASVYVPSYSVDDKVIWGGVLWNNLTGSIGSKVDEFELDNVNWEKIAYNTTDYDMVVDQIVYDYDHDQITARIDSFGNEIVSSPSQNNVLDDVFGVKNPIAHFKWGYGYDYTNGTGFMSNTVTGSIFETLNWYKTTECYGNYILGGTAVIGNPYVINFRFTGNYIHHECVVNDNYFVNSVDFMANVIINNCQVYGNVLSEASNISNNRLYSADIQINRLLNNSEITGNILDNSSEIISNTLTKDCSIDKNSILAGSRIVQNTLTDESEIRANNLNGDSYINSNILGAGDGIRANNLTNSTFTFSNTSGIIIGVHAVSAASVGENISSATIIYATYSKNMITDSSGALKLTYIDGSGTLQVVDVTT